MEDNRLIAEFMGVGSVEGSDGYFYYRDGVFFTVREKTYEKAMEAVVGYVKYRTSWDWLMPVVERIENEGAKVTIKRMACDIVYQCPLREEVSCDIGWGSGVKINAVHTAVVEFIKWYNENKKS